MGLTLVVEFKQLAEEQANSVFYKFFWEDFVADDTLAFFVLNCGRAQHAADLLILALVDSTKF
jgi:hypothetical protein